MPHPDDLAPRLQARASLLGPDGRWLAGREPGTLPLVRRAILVDGKTVGYLAVARSARPTDALAYAFLQQLGASLWPIAAAGVLLSAPVATALAIHFRRPIGRLAAGARLLAEGRFDTRLPLGRSDELGELAGHFNALAARLEAAEATRRQWVADTSHELRTPLAVLRAQIEAIGTACVIATRSTSPRCCAGARLEPPDRRALRAGAGRCRRARLPACAARPVGAGAAGSRCLARPLRGSRADLRDRRGARACARVLADGERMRQVLGNLFENCLRYTAPGGRVRLDASEDDGRLCLVVDDSAPGVPDAALARLGERFYRVDASRSRASGGAGLGLALCLRLVEAQGGSIAFAHSPPGGLRATIAFDLEGA
ncbi:ATP-binding protein [Massilia sp. Se16.2.3]|uniref:ATP-binding protein n=1 Tax=Massilia sp. Se16.2.3 TaxID=2709303 RepID=UPI0016006591|nr:ATP-binding protein [Massilia sp. Se16.2.3]QNB00719.1 HAMP domain-containing protein [Massilia sp. Se16.2.3]